MIPITAKDYFGVYWGATVVTPHFVDTAADLLARVNPLLACAEKDGVLLDINPHTHNLISGQGGGGWRPRDYPVGSPLSAHKVAQAVDIYDPHDGDLDDWCMGNLKALMDAGLYLEHPSATKGWCHLSTRAPRSDNRVFYP